MGWEKVPIDANAAPQTWRTVAFFLPDFSGGGAERMTLNLLKGLRKRGSKVLLVVGRPDGPLKSAFEAEAEVVFLGRSGTFPALAQLVRFLKSRKPDVLISAFGHNNIVALWARLLAGVHTRVIIQQHNVMSMQVATGNWRFRLLPWLYRLFAPWADAIVSVSHGVADDVSRAGHLRRSAVQVIPNPVIGDDFLNLAEGSVAHPFFAAGSPPVFICVGRLVPEKDQATTLAAFALLRARHEARLMFLGDGPLRSTLEDRVRSLGLGQDVAFEGYVMNPVPYMRRAAAMVLSSRHEGFGAVIVEALAVGTPVVSTDCPYGPSEILEKGRYGRLVPVGDAAALAEAMTAILRDAPDDVSLRRRARAFGVEDIAEQYGALIDRLCQPARPSRETADA
jgi:glycosyltransferase involved in cell wall biosynthesis